MAELDQYHSLIIKDSHSAQVETEHCEDQREDQLHHDFQ